MSASHPITSLDQNKQLVIRWFEEVWNKGNRDTIAQLFAPDGVIYDGDRIIRGPAEFEKILRPPARRILQFQNLSGFSPGRRRPRVRSLVLECKHIVTGKTAQVTGTSIVRIKDGRFVEAWQNWDAAGMAAQLSDQPPVQLF